MGKGEGAFDLSGGDHDPLGVDAPQSLRHAAAGGRLTRLNAFLREVQALMVIKAIGRGALQDAHAQTREFLFTGLDKGEAILSVKRGRIGQERAAQPFVPLDQSDTGARPRGPQGRRQPRRT